MSPALSIQSIKSYNQQMKLNKSHIKLAEKTQIVQKQMQQTHLDRLKPSLAKLKANFPIRQQILYKKQQGLKQEDKQAFAYTFTRITRSKTDNYINSQIQQAIQLVNRHEEEKYSFLKTINSNKKLYNYRTHAFEIEEIFLQQTTKVQLLPHNQQTFKIKNPVFNKLQTKKQDQHSNSNFTSRSNQTFLSKLTNSNRAYVQQEEQLQKAIHKNLNFNLQTSPNIQLESQNNIIQKQELLKSKDRIQKLQLFLKNFRGGACEVLIGYQNLQNTKQKKKYKINTQKIINFSLQNNNKKWVFLKVKSQGELCMFTLRLQYQIQTKKIKTQITQLELQHQKSKSPNKQHNRSKILKAKINSLKNINSIRSMQLLHSQQRLSKQKLDVQTKNLSNSLSVHNLKKNFNQRLNTDQGLLRLSPRQKNKSLLKKQIQQNLKLKKAQLQKKQLEVQRKKSAIQEARQKQIKLKGMALQAKKMLQIYQQIRRQEEQGIKQLFPKCVALVYLVKFHYICKKIIQDRQKGFKMAWRTRILTKKFTKILKRKYRETIKFIDGYKNRQMVNLVCLTSLFAKVLHKQCQDRSTNVFYQCIRDCKPMLRINKAFDGATRYRRALRVVQRSWLLKYNAKMQMFKHYVNVQVQQILRKYPHFKHVYSKFLAQNCPHHLSYKYMGDETSKIRSTLDDYMQKLKQIQEFKIVNKKIKQFNDKALKKHQKQYLQIPKPPCKPYDRYFRNISFLKSMVRGWFEVEYRKWAKANQAYLSSMPPSIKYKSPQKKSFKKLPQEKSINPK